MSKYGKMFPNKNHGTALEIYAAETKQAAYTTKGAPPARKIVRTATRIRSGKLQQGTRTQLTSGLLVAWPQLGVHLLGLWAKEIGGETGKPKL